MFLPSELSNGCTDIMQCEDWSHNDRKIKKVNNLIFCYKKKIKILLSENGQLNGKAEKF